MEAEQERKMWHPHLSREWIDESNFKIFDIRRKFEEKFPIFLQIKNNIKEKKEHYKFPMNEAVLFNSNTNTNKMKCACKFVKENLSLVVSTSSHENSLGKVGGSNNSINGSKDIIKNDNKDKNLKGAGEIIEMEKNNLNNKKFLRNVGFQNNEKEENNINNIKRMISNQSKKGFNNSSSEMNKSLLNKKISNNIQNNRYDGLANANKLVDLKAVENTYREAIDTNHPDETRRLVEKTDEGLATNMQEGTNN